MGHAFGHELQVTPWEGLLRAVRIAAGKVAYCEGVLRTARHDLQLEGRLARDEAGVQVDPDTGEALGVGGLRDLSFWVGQSELWHDRLARTSKMAIDAGVAERIVTQVESEGARIAGVLNTALAALASGGEESDGEGLSNTQEARLRAELRRALLALDAGVPDNVVDGEVVER